LILKILKRKKKKKFVGPVKPEPIPWDVPLDQTTPKIHFEGDITSV
jgi:hypothetical protein